MSGAEEGRGSGGGRGGWGRRSGFGEGGRFGRKSPLLTMEIAQRDVGKVIGKGGSKIRELQDNSGARIKINKGDNVIEMFGTKEDCVLAKLLIEELLYKRGGGGGGAWRDCSNGSSQDQGFPGRAQDGSSGFSSSSTNSLTFPIATKDVGKLIGKGGCKIRELEEAGQVKITFLQMKMVKNQTNMHYVHLSGHPDNMEKSQKMMINFLYPLEDKWN